MKLRGRPKGKSEDKRSFGPLGDLTRKHRFQLGLGLAEVAKACQCSVQFISNIEHGRAPLPWDKVKQLASVLKISVEELRIANLSIRSDFKTLAGTSVGKKVKKPGFLNISGMASVVALASQDEGFQDLLQRYQAATVSSRKQFVKTALEMLAH